MIASRKINFENISQIFFVLGILALFFPIRYVFSTIQTFQTGAYSDFTSISLYLCDIFLILSFLFLLPRGIYMLKSKKCLILLAFWLIIISLIRIRHQTPLNWFFLLKYIELMFVSYGTSAVFLQNKIFRLKIITLLVFLGTLESILGIWQFIIQKSVGLKYLGEQVIAPNIQGVAKIIVSGKQYIRSYGTFPHPNLLSAFLFTVLFLNIYLLLKANYKKSQFLLIICLLVNIFGFVLTFSRAAYLAFVISTLVALGVFLYEKLIDRKTWGIILIVIGGFLLSLIILKPFLLTRTTVSDNASLERVFYAKIGLKMIRKQPILGDGLGQTVLDMQNYSPIKLMPWQIQPIHNYFLLAAAEIGILGALILFIIFVLHIKQLLTQIFKNRGGDINLSIALLAIVSGYLILMQFDHYFYTIEQTQILFWIMFSLCGIPYLRE